jgi:hypothetical protein
LDDFAILKGSTNGLGKEDTLYYTQARPVVVSKVKGADKQNGIPKS